MTEKTDLETLKNELAAWHRLADVRGMHCGACSRFKDVFRAFICRHCGGTGMVEVAR